MESNLFYWDYQDLSCKRFHQLTGKNDPTVNYSSASVYNKHSQRKTERHTDGRMDGWRSETKGRNGWGGGKRGTHQAFFLCYIQLFIMWVNCRWREWADNKCFVSLAAAKKQVILKSHKCYNSACAASGQTGWDTSVLCTWVVSILRS